MRIENGSCEAERGSVCPFECVFYERDAAV